MKHWNQSKTKQNQHEAQTKHRNALKFSHTLLAGYGLSSTLARNLPPNLTPRVILGWALLMNLGMGRLNL